ncbi:NAD-dependent epimerase [Microbacterium sp. Gd 4-13]|uniref:NAD-dependent epimerase/dehydratase family protein n=1 Tax=Microbacterium sp. Gd 4-13 TaxID=2173179 RepID=UPI000D574B10|nr:NAD-dependent epimerase/dehydratase family protein [Microbacterium sp. Gd 4-13]PVW01892.1 NAD-dependent epimerase [Microbacterium sp. Gd 4-13]
MRKHFIIGAGPIGTELASHLADGGDQVRLVSRSGGQSAHPGMEHVALDATDLKALAASAAGFDVMYNCANPGPYPLWEERWPPLAASILAAAEDSGTVLVTLSNLYGYGQVDGPITRNQPLRASDHKGALRNRMWEDALAAHNAGRVRVTEARASDYLGPTATAANGLLARYATRTLSGRPARVFATPDQPHTFTAVIDIAATLAVLGADERAWGQAWLVPSNPPVTVRTMLTALNAHIGTRAPTLTIVPRWLLRAAGAFIPMLREVNGVLYQFDHPFVSDALDTTTTFGITPTNWDRLIGPTAHAWTARNPH